MRTYNRNEWLKHCLEVKPGRDRLLVKLFAIGSGRVVVELEIPVSGPRIPEDMARGMLDQWDPGGWRQADTDSKRIPYLRKLCGFYARASDPEWSWPEGAELRARSCTVETV